METGDEDRVSGIKLQHDVEQIRYLSELPHLNETQRRQCEEALATFLAAEADPNPARIAPLSPSQRAAMGRFYNKAWHIPDLPAAPGGAIRALDTKATVTSYRGTGAGLVVVDDVLTPEALALVRRACWESTVWYEVKQSYLKARLDDGLYQPVLQQIATELQAKLSPLLGNQPLQEIWAYKYSSEAQGLGVHADAAAVNANIWITEDDANTDPDSGGLIVYHHAVAPAAFGYGDTYGWGGSYEVQQRRILEATEYANVTVPYKANRLILFNSSLYHKTDKFRFRTGYTKRRINLTFLFGHAAGQHSSSGWLQFA